MPKVTIIQVIYNNRNWIPAVFDAIFKQTFKDFNVVVVIAGNEDKSKELLMELYPQAKSHAVSEFLQNLDTGTGIQIIDPGYNIGFAKGHNLVFSSFKAEFFQLVNPDMIMQSNYLEEMLKAFKDEKVGGATGKLYQISSQQSAVSSQQKQIDTTGVVISKSGRARDRGQHEVDIGQYDNQIQVDAISAAGAMYRAEALRSIRYKVLGIREEFFDEDFHSYWEDVDLSWRMKNQGWKNVFVPTAVGHHGRTAGSSRGGYFHFIDFIKHHRNLPKRIRQLNYKNHIFMYIKNSSWFYPQFFVREFFMLLYILLFEISTLKIVPEMVRLLSKMWEKRRLIKKLSALQS